MSDRPPIFATQAASCGLILWADGKPAGTCWREPVEVGAIRYPWPKPAHWGYVFLCSEHVGLVEHHRPLTDRDRAELARRRDEDTHWARVREENRRNAGWNG